MNDSNLSNRENSRSRKRLLKFITLSVPLIILMLLEGGLRLVSYGDNLNLFINNPAEGYENYLMLNPKVGKKYFQKLEYTSPPNDIFLKKKAQSTFRIFVMGSSTVVGFPYSYNLMFSRILHKRLEDSFPDKNIEVINTAITAINSFTLRDYTKEIIKYDPDAIVLYAGHNEFYGAFGIGSNESMSKSHRLTQLHLYLMDVRFYQLIRNITNSILQKIASSNSNQVHGTLMKRIVAKKSILNNSEEYQSAMESYEQNMGDLIRKFNKQNIPVFLSEVISNVKDIVPLSSVSTGTEDEAWELYGKAVKAYNTADYENAQKFFYEAKDVDGVRFRASEDVNLIINDLSQEYDTYLVPMLDYFKAKSPHQIIGNTLLTEHVHPNIKGGFLMAEAFYSEILKSGIIGDSVESYTYPSEYYQLNWGYTRLDSLLANHRIDNLKNYWPFVSAEANLHDYRLSYSPNSKLDSIAFLAFKDPEQYIDEMRLELAKEYTRKGDHSAAYKEYEALLRSNPYLAVNYRDAASSLINLGHLPLALKYYRKSLEYDRSFYALYRIGEIYLIKSDYSNAIKSFKDAFSMATEDSDKIKVLGKLYISYMYGGQKDNAEAIAQKLNENNASQYLRIPPRTYTYNNYIPFKTRNQINSALQMMSESKYSDAIFMLEGSLEIYDSHMAHKYLGEAYLKTGNRHKALYHLKIVYSEFLFDPKFLSSLIFLNISVNELHEAGELLNELKGIDPNFSTINTITQLLSQTQGAI